MKSKMIEIARKAAFMEPRTIAFVLMLVLFVLGAGAPGASGGSGGG